MEEQISLTLNGQPEEITADPSLTLLWVLRDRFGLTGAKFGCGIGRCGACTVVIDREPARACTVPMINVKGREVVTIEGLSANGDLHPIQKSFMSHDALQCGFCTPGMIMNAYSLLLKNPEPTRGEVITGMEENLCRCGAHIRIIEAIQAAGREMKGGK